MNSLDTLTRHELQEMLRGIGVKAPRNADIETLKQILKEENHALWTRAIKMTCHSGNKTHIRKRSKKESPEISELEKTKPVRKKIPLPNPLPKDEHRFRRPPTPQASIVGAMTDLRAAKAIKPFDPKEKIARSILKRANGQCELCGLRAKVMSKTQKPFLQIVNIASNKSEPRTYRHFSALCKDCAKRIRTAPIAEELKSLRKKARGNLIATVEFISRRPQRLPHILNQKSTEKTESRSDTFIKKSSFSKDRKSSFSDKAQVKRKTGSRSHRKQSSFKK